MLLEQFEGEVNILAVLSLDDDADLDAGILPQAILWRRGLLLGVTVLPHEAVQLVKQTVGHGRCVEPNAQVHEAVGENGVDGTGHESRSTVLVVCQVVAEACVASQQEAEVLRHGHEVALEPLEAGLVAAGDRSARDVLLSGDGLEAAQNLAAGERIRVNAFVASALHLDKDSVGRLHVVVPEFDRVGLALLELLGRQLRREQPLQLELESESRDEHIQLQVESADVAADLELALAVEADWLFGSLEGLGGAGNQLGELGECGLDVRLALVADAEGVDEVEDVAHGVVEVLFMERRITLEAPAAGILEV